MEVFLESQISKVQILENIDRERSQLETLLVSLEKDQMLAPVLENNWTVKDVLAHIVAWEQRMQLWIEQSLRGETPQRPAPGYTWEDLDRLNAETYEANRARSYEDIQADFETSYRTALATVQNLSEADLIEPDRFAWRAGVPLWYLVSANTWEHYAEHADDIRRRLELDT